MAADGGHPIFSCLYAIAAPMAERTGMAERRRRLLAAARGRVVEIGAGTGLNLVYYPPAVHQVVATEPDPHMLRRARHGLAHAAVPVRLERAWADELPLEDSWADTAVATVVLCSVRDPDLALAEIRRVLRPGGRLLFLEHVRSVDPRLARRQDRWAGPWSVVAGGCRPNRDTIAAIEQAGFELEGIERYDLPGVPIVRPHVSGWAGRGP